MNGLPKKLVNFSGQVCSGIKVLRHTRLSSLGKVFSLMGKREKILLGALAAVAALSLAWSGKNLYYSLTASAPAEGGSFTEGVLGQPAYLNPLLAYQETDLAVVHLVYSGLYKYDAAGRLVPDLAEGLPQISSVQKQYTINLKKNVKWHDGQPFTAEDVLFTIQILKDPEYKSPLRALWLSTTVEKLSDYSVKFTTKDISGPFLQNLTQALLSRETWSRVEPQNFPLSTRNLEAIGTGPFAIKEIKKLPSGKIQSISLESFAEYYNGRPKLQDVMIKFYDTEEEILNALHSKEISGLGFTSLSSSLFLEQDQEDLAILRLPLPQYQMVFFNLGNKILSEENVRLALKLATDRQKIISSVFQDKAILPSSPSGFGKLPQTPDAFGPDLEKARQLLDQAGWKRDEKTGLLAKKSQVLEVTIATNDALPNSKAAEELSRQWQNLGIKVNLAVLPTKQLTDTLIRPRTFEVLLLPQKFGSDPDPFPFWHSSQIKDPGLNLTGFENADADRLITEARTTTDQALRLQKYQEFDRLIDSKTPVIYLNQSLYLYAIDKNIKNVSLTNLYEPNHRFYSLPEWYINEKRVWK
jgi:peptide/nickel transport system substrate-binding protein